MTAAFIDERDAFLDLYRGPGAKAVAAEKRARHFRLLAIAEEMQGFRHPPKEQP